MDLEGELTKCECGNEFFINWENMVCEKCKRNHFTDTASKLKSLLADKSYMESLRDDFLQRKQQKSEDGIGAS